MILCDTNIFIEFYKGNPEILARLQSIGQPNLAVSAITEAELYFGALNKSELKMIRKHLAAVFRIPVDVAISDQFLILMQTYSLSHKLSLPDALIAATALAHSMDLYTLNTGDFQFIPELQLFQPSDIRSDT